MIKITHKYRQHSGGSKFYETVIFEDSNNGPSVLVKRFGKIAQRNGGGQYKIENYNTATEAINEDTRIWKEKGKPKEYSGSASLPFGFGLFNGGVSSDYADKGTLVRDTIGHYADDEGAANTIVDFLSLAATPNDPQPKPVVAWKPTETEDFGSW